MSNSNQKAKFEKAAKYAELAQATGTANDPLLAMYYRGLAAGSDQTAGKSIGILDNLLTGPALLLQLNSGTKKAIRPLRKEEGVILGREIATGFPVGLRFEELPLQTYELGMTGAGKTNLNILIFTQLPERVCKVFIDSKKESSRIQNVAGRGVIAAAHQLYDNPLETVGDPIASRLSRFEHVAAHMAIDERSWPDVPALMADVEASMPPNSPSLSLMDTCHLLDVAGEKNPKFRTVAARLWPIANMLKERARVRTGPDVFSRYAWIALDYSGIPSNIRNVLHACMLDKLAQRVAMEGHTTALKIAFFWDEGLDVFAKEHTSTRAGSGYVSYQRTTASQGRSYGFGHFISAQYAGQIDRCGAANSNNLIVLSQKDHDEARECSRLLGAGDALTDAIQRMPRGHALLRTPSHPDPLHIVIPLLPLTSYRSTEDIQNEMATEIAWMRDNSVLSPERRKRTVSVTYADVFPEDAAPSGTADLSDTDPFDIRDEHRAFIAEVLAHPAASIVEHYSNLGWSAGRGTRVKTHLLDNRILESHKQLSANGRPIELLVLSAKGKGYFGDYNQS